ncbi:MAG: hypothetical protein U0800_01455 [Isosphaeraceae bacterium]
MGSLSFRLPANLGPERRAELRRGYVTGLDRVPERIGVEFRDNLLIVHRDRIESGRVHLPWLIDGFGLTLVSTATLVERETPYSMILELARGKLNDVLNQAADWHHLGLKIGPDLESRLRSARGAFGEAATHRDQPSACDESAQRCLAAAHQAAVALVEAYTGQVLARRLEHAPRLPTLISCEIEGATSSPAPSWANALPDAINTARIACPWRQISPEEGQLRFDEIDAQLQWCRKRKLIPTAGPLIDFRPAALPDWLWLWEGDFEAILGMVSELVRRAVARYRGKISAWHLIGRPGSSEILGLSEEEQFRITARALQIARLADPDVHLVVDLDRPWADWMAQSLFHLGPLHLADNLVRAEVGLSGIGLEVAPGYSSPGSPMHDLLDFSRLLDLFSLLNVPLHLTMAAPSAATPDDKADPNVRVEANQWPRTPDEATQKAWAEPWVALAVAKPFVRSVTWRHACDGSPHLYPHAGLFRPDQTPKPLLDWLKRFRGRYLS